MGKPMVQSVLQIDLGKEEHGDQEIEYDNSQTQFGRIQFLRVSGPKEPSDHRCCKHDTRFFPCDSTCEHKQDYRNRIGNTHEKVLIGIGSTDIRKSEHTPHRHHHDAHCTSKVTSVDAEQKLAYQKYACTDAQIEEDTLADQLGHWISETMELMDDAAEQCAFMKSNIICITEESEIYIPDDQKAVSNRYFAFGNSLVAALKRGDIGSAIGLLNMQIGKLYRFDGTQLIELMDALQKWDGYHELVEAEYRMLGGG